MSKNNLNPVPYRPGNIVYDNMGEQRTIIATHVSGLVTYYDGNDDIDFMPDGILLTPDWLDRLGFQKQNNRKYVQSYLRESDYSIEPGLFEWFTKDKFELSLIDSRLFFGIHSREYSEYECDIDLMEVKSVHQLQNLYFALTGTELTLKP